MEILQSVWTWIASALGGVTLAGIITGIIYGCLKGAFNRAINKINVEKISEKATEKGIDRVKEVTFKHSIQPLVESELKKVNEYSVEVLREELVEVKREYNHVIGILEKLAAYFDNSIGVSESAKKELHQAIEEAKSTVVDTSSTVSIDKSEEDIKPLESTKNDLKTTKKVER